MTESETELAGQLPEDVGRRPEASELGAYARFVIESHDLPKLYRKDNLQDFFQWLNSREMHRLRHFGQKLTLRPLNKWYYKHDKLWNNGRSHLLDFIVHIHLIIGVILLGVGAGFPAERLLEGVGALFGIVLVDSYALSDKIAYRGWIERENTERAQRCIWEMNDKGREVGWRESFWNLSALIGTGKTEFPNFKDFNSQQGRKITEAHRYDLAVLRTRVLWNNPGKAEEYAEWQNLNKEERRTEEKKDEELTTALKRYIEKEALADLKQGLAKVMSEEDSEDYLPTLVEVDDGADRPLFWLTREITLKEGNADRSVESGFLEWVEEVLRTSKVHYLVSEAAKGKTTTLNLLAIHHLRTDVSGIWPIRVKLRKFSSRSEKANLNLMARIRAAYVDEADAYHYETIDARFDWAIKGGDSDDRPLVILDGLDELPQTKQARLMDELNQYQGDIPIIVATRPISAVLEREHAVLGNMTGLQRTEVLRNLKLDPEELERVERLLPESLIDRPFALLIAARELKKSAASVDHPDVNLSLFKICEIYEEEYFEREKEKRTDDEDLRDHRVFVPALKTALRNLALEQLRGNSSPSDDLVSKEKLTKAEKLNIIGKDDLLTDTWLEGYYASKSDNLVREDWDRILKNLSSKPDRRDLIVRHFVARAAPSETPNWNKLGSHAPIVMDIAGQEWLAMNLANRRGMLERLGVPHDDKGRLAFEGNEEFLGCEFTELLSLMHFHCMIAESERWHSDEGVNDLQWEYLFTEITSRYYSEFKDKIEILKRDFVGDQKSQDQNLIEWGLKFAMGENLSCTHTATGAFLKALHGKEITRVRKLVPYNHFRTHSHPESIYCENATPSPLLDFIEKSLVKSSDELEALIFSVGMIEIHARRTLFKLERSVLEERVPSAYEITGPSWERARILLHRIIGIRDATNNWLIGRLEEMKPPQSRFGIPMEIRTVVREKRKVLAGREFGSVKEFETLLKKGGDPLIPQKAMFFDSGLKPIKENWKKEEFSAIGVRIAHNSYSVFIIPSSISDPGNLLHLLPSINPQNAAVAYFNRDITWRKREEIREKFESEKEAEIQILLEGVEGLDLEVASKKWEKWTKGRVRKASRDWWEGEEGGRAYTSLPADGAYQRRMVLHRNQFIIPKIGLGYDFSIAGHYLISFRPSTSIDRVKGGMAISLYFHRDLISWCTGGDPSPSFVAPLLPEANEKLGEIYQKFLGINNARFHPSSAFHDVKEELGRLKRMGKVAVYLKSSDMTMRGDKPYRQLFVPGTIWWNPEFSDLTFEIGTEGERGAIEKAFSDIFSAIPEPPADAHLNRWYAVDFVLDNDFMGYRVFHPDFKSIGLLCQICATVPVEVEGLADQKFVCGGCSEWAQRMDWWDS